MEDEPRKLEQHLPSGGLLLHYAEWIRINGVTSKVCHSCHERWPCRYFTGQQAQGHGGAAAWWFLGPPVQS